MNSNLILFLFSNAVFVPYIKGKHRLGRKGPHCAGLHFTAGKPQHILVLVSLMKFNNSLPHWNHRKSKVFWRSLLASGKAWNLLYCTHAHTSRCLFASLLHQSLYRPPVSPYRAASSRSWKPKHELLVFVLILSSAARGSLPTSSAVRHWEESTEDWPQNKGSIYPSLFSQSIRFLWGFQIRGHQGNAAARSFD